MKTIIIFDADGVLLDTKGLVKNIVPNIDRLRGAKFYDIARKIVILFHGDRITDDRLPDLPGVKETLYKLVVWKNVDLYIVTKRPFWFGGKKRLMEQLNTKCPGCFMSKNVFSSFLSKDKAKVVKNKIWHPGMQGFFVDDNNENLANMPEGILSVWLASDEGGTNNIGATKITEFSEILNLV